MNNIHYTRNWESVDKHKKIFYEIIFKAQSDVFYLWVSESTVWIHVSKKIQSNQSKDKHLISQVYTNHLVNYVSQSDTIFKVFKLEKKDSTDSLIIVRDADINEKTDWKLYNNLNLSMSNLNSVSEIQKAVASISIISVIISISSAQKMQKHEICFEIKYFDEKFNLSKNNWSYNYDDNSIDNENSDDEESDQKFSMKSIHLVLL